MFFAATFISLLQVATLAHAAFTPKNIHARHAALHHARAPVPAPAPVALPAQPLKKRDSRKCRARPSASSSVAPAPSPVAPVNPASDPSSPSPAPEPTHKQVNTPPPPPPAPSPSPSPAQQPHTQSHKASPTTSAHHDKPTNSPAPPAGGNNGSGGGGGGSSPFGSFLSGTQRGQLTYYSLGLTACGTTPTDSDHVAAVSHSLFDVVPGSGANPNNNPICGKKAAVTYNGKTVVVALEDRCQSCLFADLDLSPSAFSALADQSLGRLSGATWVLVD